MNKEHQYDISVTWTGNKGTGTSSYKDFDRCHVISASNKVKIEGSSDPAFRGDKTKYNPEELLIASLSSCHMLWYLHLCSEEGIIVLEYQDSAKGSMIQGVDGSGAFKQVTLYPTVVVSKKSMIDKAMNLHKKASKMCFIANSVNFKILYKGICKIARF